MNLETRTSSASRTRLLLACFSLLTALAALAGAASPASALESSWFFFNTLDSDPGWTSAASCQVSYANTCTGWAWAWGGWSPGDRLGTAFDTCCEPGQTTTLVDSRVRFVSGSPTGYGFTGTVSVFDADANSCPQGSPLGTTAFLPATGDNIFSWGIPVPDRFVLVVSIVAPIISNPALLASDHPAGGPTGPQACGTCYPSTRTTHSFYYGTAVTTLCPGSPANDGTCNVEWKIDVGLACEGDPTSVAEGTWARIKSYYR